ncbi:hypothetical protein RJ639_029754 [Escallonia herrerae]|uniref:B box-type domain-containing protein n=1 Tax=Escallonia herrerae TaxID=1293975 RepID=A0AA88X2M4_9ASTE|nr:hypothetical protein RJ639_029754 [Escallonia herrerae]
MLSTLLSMCVCVCAYARLWRRMVKLKGEQPLQTFNTHEVGLASIPRWLEVLLAKEFFNSCLVHEAEKKNEENTFCLDCCTGLCSHCLPPHKAHNLLQIRRYVYQDVLRLSDAYKLMDCSSVQSYKTNSTKVVFLNQRPMTRQLKGSGNSCIICYRNLQDPNLFCSISCKVCPFYPFLVNALFLL